MSERVASSKSADAYRTISEVAEDLGLPQHVLRFWETRFPQVKPLKRAGGRRFYRPEDVELLRAVKTLLYQDGYTIKGVQRMLRDQGPRSTTALAATSPSSPSHVVEHGATSDEGRRGRSGGDAFDGPPMPDERPASPQPRALEPDGPVGDRLPNAASWPAQNAALDVVGCLEAVLSELVACEQLVRRITSA